MYLLGISCYYHDAAVALLRDGVLVAAAEEERFSRIKHDSGYPVHAIRYCLETAGISTGDLDYVVFYEKPFIKFERILKTTLQTTPRSMVLFREAMSSWLLDKLWIEEHICTDLGLPRNKILFSEHHLSHAASTFYCSPFEEAAILTVDGVGDRSCGLIGQGKGAALTIEQELRFPHSWGLLYSAFTAYLGFQVNEGEYKVMGMAPYGKPRFVEEIRKTFKMQPDGSLWLDLSYFEFYRSTTRSFSQRLVDLLGPPRDPKDADQLDPRTCDVAASIQKVTEEGIVAMARHALKQSGCTKLCYAGGVALNSVANHRILQETSCDGLFVQPAAGDSGGALGAALYAYHALLGRPRSFVMEHAYWGQAHPEASVVDFLKGQQIPFTAFNAEDKLLDQVVGLLTEGKVVGWVQGRFEWGPRALGNRSILADPRRAEMKDIVNRKIKFREPFRPFAPSVLSSAVPEYFDTAGGADLAARFMLVVPQVREQCRDRIPAVTHADGSGRLQSVEPSVNPLYAKLIKRFGAATGVPVVLNTSFNLKGEAMVNTPAEAYSTYQRSGLDALVLGNCLLTKQE